MRPRARPRSFLAVILQVLLSMQRYGAQYVYSAATATCFLTFVSKFAPELY